MDFSRLTDPQAYKDALAGLLRRGTEVGEYIQEAPTKVGQSIMDAGQRQSALMNKAFDPTGNTLIRDKESANQAAMNLFEGPMAFAPVGMINRKELLEDSFSKINQPRKGTTQVNVPISLIEHGESALAGGKLTFPTAKDTIKSYASKDTPFPPIDLMGDATSKIPFMVADGSHRLEAAKLRGDKTIPAYLDKEDMLLLDKLTK
jgi:hypothetical protein